MFLDELISVFVNAGVGTFPGNIFASSKAQLPNTDGPFLTLSETSGSGPEGTHNSTQLPAYVRPNAQIVARAKSYPVARNMAEAAFAAVYPVRNQLVAGVWWRQVVCLQNPFDLGSDDVGRVQVVFNIQVTRRPNAAMSQ